MIPVLLLDGVPQGDANSVSLVPLQTITYNMCIFFFDFLFPAIVIVFSYVFIVKAIFAHEAAMREQAKKMNVTNLRSNVSYMSLETHT